MVTTQLLFSVSLISIIKSVYYTLLGINHKKCDTIILTYFDTIVKLTYRFISFIMLIVYIRYNIYDKITLTNQFTPLNTQKKYLQILQHVVTVHINDAKIIYHLKKKIELVSGHDNYHL